jgi:hypothetical protein
MRNTALLFFLGAAAVGQSACGSNSSTKSSTDDGSTGAIGSGGTGAEAGAGDDAISGGNSSGGSSSGSAGSSSGSSGGADSGTADGGRGDASGADAGHHINHVFLIMMENHNWSDIHGSASAPYINNTLLPMSSYCTNYYDNPSAAHPSLPNYLWLEAGGNFGITNDNNPSSDHQSTTNHLATLLTAAGVTWKAYEEDIPGTNCPVVNVNNYAVRHDPFVYFDDVSGNPPSATNVFCKAHVRPYTELATDLSSDSVAQYAFITPNVCDDMHDNCTGDPIAQGDTWLSNNVPTILASSAYKNGGAIFITWDESEGGEVPIGMIVLSPFARGGGYSSATRYYHSSMLRTAQEIFGVTPLIRDAANQPDLSALFSSFP